MPLDKLYRQKAKLNKQYIRILGAYKKYSRKLKRINRKIREENKEYEKEIERQEEAQRRYWYKTRQKLLETPYVMSPDISPEEYRKLHAKQN